MTYRALSQRLRKLGCEFVRTAAGSHEIWWRPSKKRFTTIPRHANRDIPAGTLRAILRDLDITRAEFETKN
jgi:predicted RNA binding protein YcfA (HicA-like mRNA interferase family)